MSFHSNPPVRGQLCNLATGLWVEFLMNPTEFSEQIRVQYSRLSAPGQGHQVHHYQHTENTGIPIEFYLRSSGAQSSLTEDRLLAFRRFLQELTKPTPSIDRALSTTLGPPQVLVVWPGLLAMTCIVSSVEFRYREFTPSGKPKVCTALATFEEVSPSPYLVKTDLSLTRFRHFSETMPPRLYSRYEHCSAHQNAAGRWFLSQRQPFRYRDLPDNRVHEVRQQDSLWGLAGLYFRPKPRACGFWWVLCDFQPHPILDPTLALELGRKLVIPSLRTLDELILAPPRRSTHA